MSADNLSPIHVGTAIKSLRNTDFELTSALCEVIDNSIEAEAKKIQITINAETPPGKRRKRPVTIAVGDDGIGMNPDVLQSCLKLGYSGRYDNRKGIGRFGVGMTFGAISLCQRIQVYSRENQGNWNYTFLDISAIEKDKDPTLHPVEQRNLPEEYKKLVGDYGTLVIWDKIDRIDTSYDEQKLIHNIGRIYRKFIGLEIIENKKVIKNPNIREITVNKDIVSAHDPLYATKIRKFPDDEVATLEDEHHFYPPVHEVDAPTSGEKTGEITIRSSLLPESWRMQRAKTKALPGEGSAGSGNSSANNKRMVKDNEGISILRNGREVYYGHTRAVLPASKEIDRFWGCEIDFDPVLDHWFSVRNIKIGARPLDDLKDTLKAYLKPAIENNLRKKITDRMDKTEHEIRESTRGPFNTNINSETTLTPITSVPPVSPEEIKPAIEKEVEEKYPDDAEKQREYKVKLEGPMKYIIHNDKNAQSGGNFIDIVDNIGKKVVNYNMNHSFFLAVFEKIDDIERTAQKNNSENEELVGLANGLKNDLDNLIYGYIEGTYDLHDTGELQKPSDIMAEHLLKWSFHLRKPYK